MEGSAPQRAATLQMLQQGVPLIHQGVLVVGDAQLSGRHTLTFQLARANHATVTNRAARVVVRDVLFEGP